MLQIRKWWCSWSFEVKPNPVAVEQAKIPGLVWWSATSRRCDLDADMMGSLMWLESVFECTFPLGVALHRSACWLSSFSAVLPPMMKMVVTGSAGVLMLSCLLIYFVKSSPQVEKEEQLEIASCKYGPWRQEGKCSVSCGDGVMKMFRLPENTSEKRVHLLGEHTPLQRRKVCKALWGAMDRMGPLRCQLHQEALLPGSQQGKQCWKSMFGGPWGKWCCPVYRWELLYWLQCWWMDIKRRVHTSMWRWQAVVPQGRF